MSLLLLRRSPNNKINNWNDESLFQTSADTDSDNYTAKGNVNPYKDEKGTKQPAKGIEADTSDYLKKYPDLSCLTQFRPSTSHISQ
jgi:hypothetical protein